MNYFITHPLLKGVQLGSHEWFRAQKMMIRQKPLVRDCYDLWYRRLLADADSVESGTNQRVLELGSGSSYLQDLRPSIITSDVEAGLADLVVDGRSLPFGNATLSAIVMTHVMHHIPDVEQFFREVDRVLVPGGVVSMVEVTHTPFARFFFSVIHPEPFRDRVEEWSFPAGNTMLDSNQALSWILFYRDRPKFDGLFPSLTFEAVGYLPWFSYLASGGVNLRSLVPPLAAPLARALDRLLQPLDRLLAIHWHIRVRKVAP
jgi:SAM-dependent methyltransferase